MNPLEMTIVELKEYVNSLSFEELDKLVETLDLSEMDGDLDVLDLLTASRLFDYMKYRNGDNMTIEL